MESCLLFPLYTLPAILEQTSHPSLELKEQLVVSQYCGLESTWATSCGEPILWSLINLSNKLWWANTVVLNQLEQQVVVSQYCGLESTWATSCGEPILWSLINLSNKLWWANTVVLNQLEQQATLYLSVPTYIVTDNEKTNSIDKELPHPIFV